MTEPVSPPADASGLPGNVGYKVTRTGEVWSCMRGHGVVGTTWYRLRPKTLKSGHLVVSVNHKWRRVHHLVLLTFVGECPPGQECRHLNDNPTDNNLTNLCWGTRLENRADMVRNGKSARGERTNKAKVTEEQVRAIRRLATSLDQRSLAERFGLSNQQVSRIVKRQRWKHVE